MPENYPIAIIGGGISGVSFAHFAALQGYKSIILEQSHKLGGCIETYHSPKTRDFWLELGTHTIYNSYQHLISFCHDNGLLSHLQKREKHPFKLLTSQNQIASVLSKLNLIRMGFGLSLFKLSKAGNRTVEQYFSFVFGRNNYQKTLRYCFDAVLCQNSQNFPADFLFKTRSKNKSLPRSFTFDRGMSTLFTKVNTKNTQINLSTAVKAITKQNDRWCITTDDGVLTADKLVLATPWHISHQLLAQTNHPLARIKHQPGISKLATTGLVFDKDKIKHIKPINGLIGIKQDFFSMVTRDTLTHEKYRGMTVHFKNTDTPYQQLIDMFLSKLNIPKDALIDIKHKDNNLPCYQSQHQDFIDGLNNELIKDNSLALTGNYFTRLAVEDCVKRSFDEVKRILH
ncbi:NAD(P)-binding protein [Cysteiniphilum halobium]|uniref:NAD(P)-binding protein n=1 Tax=Cysteiniphilum halobium TaxID=2219059 RepID=UPI003F860F04